MARHLLRIPLLVGCVVLPSCGIAGLVRSTDHPTDGSPPLARATDSGIARLTIVTCGFVSGSADDLIKVIESLAAQGPLVSARGDASASVVVNTCGGPPPLRRP